jgi:hypothetical protein
LDVPEEFLAACFYLPVGRLAVRVDRLERLSRNLRQLARVGPFSATSQLAMIIGASEGELPGVLSALGFAGAQSPEGAVFLPRGPRKIRRRRGQRRGPATDATSPFAGLRRLIET